jgi:hypothetical protein
MSCCVELAADLVVRLRKFETARNIPPFNHAGESFAIFTASVPK